MTSCEDRETAFFESQVETHFNPSQMDKLILINKELTSQLNSVSLENKALKSLQHHRSSIEESGFSFAPEDSLKKEIELLRKENSELRSRALGNSSQTGDQSSFSDFKTSVDLSMAQIKIDKLKSHNQFLQRSLTEAQSLEEENKQLSTQLIEIQSRQSIIESDHQNELTQLQRKLVESDSHRITVQEQLIRQQLHVKKLEDQINELQRTLANISGNCSMNQSAGIWPMTAGDKLNEELKATELSVNTLNHLEVLPKTKDELAENQTVLKSAMRRSTSRKVVKFEKEVQEKPAMISNVHEVIYVLPDGRRVNAEEYKIFKLQRDREYEETISQSKPLIPISHMKQTQVYNESCHQVLPDSNLLQQNDKLVKRTYRKEIHTEDDQVSEEELPTEIPKKEESQIKIRGIRRSHRKEDPYDGHYVYSQGNRLEEREGRDRSRKHKKESKKRKREEGHHRQQRYDHLFSADAYYTNIQPPRYDCNSRVVMHYPSEYLQTSYESQSQFLGQTDASISLPDKQLGSAISSIGFDPGYQTNPSVFQTTNTNISIREENACPVKKAFEAAKEKGQIINERSRERTQTIEKDIKASIGHEEEDFDITKMIRANLRKVFAENGLLKTEEISQASPGLKDFGFGKRPDELLDKDSMKLAVPSSDSNFKEAGQNLFSKNVSMHQESMAKHSRGIDTMKLIQGYHSGTMTSSHLNKYV